MNLTALTELSRSVERESHEGSPLLKSPFDNSICQLCFDEDARCIQVVWRKYATSAQLRYIHEIILLMLDQYKVDRILGDDSDLPIVHAEDQQWIVDEWLPRARLKGLRAVATTVSMTFFGRLSIRSVQSRLAREIQVQNFGSVHTARSWLKALS